MSDEQQQEVTGVQEQDCTTKQQTAAPTKHKAAPQKRGRKSRIDKAKRISVVMSQDTEDRLKVLARGLDRDVSWVIRDCIEAELDSDLRLGSFAEQQVRDDAAKARIRGEEPPADTPATRVLQLLDTQAAETTRELSENSAYGPNGGPIRLVKILKEKA